MTALQASRGYRPPAARRLLSILDITARKLLGAVATVLVATFVIFATLSATPGDPVDQVVGPHASAAAREATRHALGLDRPFFVRFADWIGSAIHGDFGRSIVYREPVAGLIAPRVLTTVYLVLMAAALILVIGVLLGALGGTTVRLRPLVSAVVGLGISVPAYVAATVLLGVFAVTLGWFPTYGAGDGFLGRVHHLALPAVALSIGFTAYVAQMTMAAVHEEAGKEHVMTAVGRGLSRGIVFRRHVLRNASLPVLTASGLTVAGLVAGTVIVETAFGIDGIGSLLMKSVLDKDYPVVLAVSVLIVVVFVVITTLLDLAQSLLDPRTRPSGATR